jgi:hypothetical protein
MEQEYDDKMREYLKKEYRDYRDDQFNCGPKKFIWGVKSPDDQLPDEKPSFITLNELELIFDRRTRTYELWVDTPNRISNGNEEIRYLSDLLHKFCNYITYHNRPRAEDERFYFSDRGLNLDFKGPSVINIYQQFYIYVFGYISSFGRGI